MIWLFVDNAECIPTDAMRHPLSAVLGLALLILSVDAHPYTDNDGPKPTAAQKDAVNMVVTRMLDVKFPPEKQTRHRINNPATKYMRHLFEQFRTSSIKTADQDIVRSMLPQTGSLNSVPAFVFDLSALQAGETLLKAELHFQRHKKVYQHPRSWKEYTARVVCSSCQGTSIVATPAKRTLTGHRQWMAWDLFKQTQQALNTSKPSLTVQFYHNNHLLLPDAVYKRHSPFLLVYTSADNFLDGTAGQVADSDEDDDFNDIEHTNRVKRAAFDAMGASYYSYNHDEEPDTTKEVKLLENRVPIFTAREQAIRRQMREFVKNGPKALISRKHRNRRRKHRKNKNKHADDPMMGFGQMDNAIDDNDDSMIHGDDSLRQLLLSKQPKKQTTQEDTCGKRKFSVSFRDIGWQEVVISPTHFEAYYCAGSCEFPQNKDTKVTNHALIQSIVSTMDVYGEVPKVCCAPDKMDSLTLLYFDDSGNVVLKNYPRMVVKSCGCL
uniref:TGF_BETA_2 domain-containing protein n=1 Tax=Panagrellus redivivus TaxID=6233 RepID=A0A7E4VMH4_PANRE